MRILSISTIFSHKYSGQLGEYVKRKKISGVSGTLIHYGVPWLGKKAVEMGRYYASEAMRNTKLQKKVTDFTLDKLNPMIQDVGSQALDQLSTKVRPKRKYKTDLKDLNGDSLLTSGVKGSPG